MKLIYLLATNKIQRVSSEIILPQIWDEPGGGNSTMFAGKAGTNDATRKVAAENPLHDRMNWFVHTRFGMFIHWGLYAINAWHEQEQMRRVVPRAKYAGLIEKFNPRKFDPEAWLDLAQQAGMKYICFTTKHHDGFCLWDTKLTDFNVTNSPYGRDVLAELASACHKRAFPLCLYYSVVDWHHPGYPNKNQSHELAGPEPGDQPDLHAYIDYLKAQICELCTNYGQIHGIWWDMNQTGVVDESIHDMIYTLQPAAVINNRGFGKGDFGTPERDWDKSMETSLVFSQPTEACNSVGSESWGYRSDEDYYTSEYLIREIDKVLARGGNYLLNVGPDADGCIPRPSQDILNKIGCWMKFARESIEGCEPVSHLTENRNVLLTRKNGEIYVHLNRRPITNGVILKPMVDLPRNAILLNDNRNVEFRVTHLPDTCKEQTEQLHLQNLPIEEFGEEVMIVKLL